MWAKDRIFVFLYNQYSAKRLEIICYTKILSVQVNICFLMRSYKNILSVCKHFFFPLLLKFEVVRGKIIFILICINMEERLICDYNLNYTFFIYVQVYIMYIHWPGRFWTLKGWSHVYFTYLHIFQFLAEHHIVAQQMLVD